MFPFFLSRVVKAAAGLRFIHTLRLSHERRTFRTCRLAMAGCCLLLFLARATDAAAQTTLSTVNTGSSPINVALNTATNTAYIVNENSDTVSAISGVNGTVTTIPVCHLPQAAGANPVTNKIYVACRIPESYYSYGGFSVIDGATNAVTTFGGGTSPSYPNYPPFLAVAVNTVTNMVYFSTGGGVSIYNGANNAFVGTIGYGAGPGSIALNPVTNIAYTLEDNNSGYPGELNANNGATRSTTQSNVGDAPSSVAVNWVTNTIYVANYNSDTVSVVNGTSNAVITTVSTGTGPYAIAVRDKHRRHRKRGQQPVVFGVQPSDQYHLYR